MSPIHCAPRDSVGIFRDIRARRALGMHWGYGFLFALRLRADELRSDSAWVLTTEDILEPPSLLVKECAKAGVKEGAFGVCAIGETMSFDVGEDAST
jgi:N-acyl-phosphatidylethanolamine-hydrolysing phospholipase D